MIWQRYFQNRKTYIPQTDHWTIQTMGNNSSSKIAEDIPVSNRKSFKKISESKALHFTSDEIVGKLEKGKS